MNLKRKLILLLSISMLFINSACTINVQDDLGVAYEESLNKIPGIEYHNSIIAHPDSQNHSKLEIHTFIIDPELINFKIFQNKSEKEAKSIEDIYDQEKALLSLNGSFFDQEFSPIGMIGINNQILSEFRKSELSNGIFVISDNKPKLERTPPEKFDFALQNGPILLDENSEITFPKETNNYAARTAIGISKTNKIVLIFIPKSLIKINNEITLNQFAKLLKSEKQFTDLGLHSVLNLDGGVSTGFKFQTLYEPEINQVQNIIYLTAKNK